MRKLANSYLTLQNDAECWLRADSEQLNWATYFQNVDCYVHDTMTRDAFANASAARFDWPHFVAQLNSEAWPRLARVWSPQGLRWLQRVLDVNFARSSEWRDYLATSARYGVLRHYFATEWLDADTPLGVVSPVIRQASGKHHSNWARGAGTMHYHYLRNRRKQWVPKLEHREHGSTRMSVEGVNDIRFVSESLCTDLSFVHLQPLVENYFLQALGLDDHEMRTRVLTLVQGGVQTLRELVQNNHAWTTSTKQFFTRKLDSLLIAVGSPPYQVFSFTDSNKNTSANAHEALYEALLDEPEALVQNMLLARRVRNRHIWTLTNVAPRGGTGFDMPLYEINAFYDPTANSIALLAGILQPPFFSRVVQQPAILYARMLAIVAHELGHSMDPNGRLADWSGSVLPAGYWEDSMHVLDRMAFTDSEQCLVHLYDGATSRAGNRENGMLTLAENLADHIGLRVGYNTMMKQLGSTEPRQTLQRDFMLAWAQSWCARLTSAQEAATAGERCTCVV